MTFTKIMAATYRYLQMANSFIRTDQTKKKSQFIIDVHPLGPNLAESPGFGSSLFSCSMMIQKEPMPLLYQRICMPKQYLHSSAWAGLR